MGEEEEEEGWVWGKLWFNIEEEAPRRMLMWEGGWKEEEEGWGEGRVGRGRWRVEVEVEEEEEEEEEGGRGSRPCRAVRRGCWRRRSRSGWIRWVGGWMCT